MLGWHAMDRMREAMRGIQRQPKTHVLFASLSTCTPGRRVCLLSNQAMT